MKLEWSKDFSVKNLELDRQHEAIFEIANMANELAFSIQKEPSLDYQEELKKVTLKLFEYIKTHFKDEEKFMKSINFPLLAEHRQSHQDLIYKTKEILKYSDDVEKFSQELSILVKYWILEHLITEDKWIANFTSKALHLNEIHYTLEQYIKLKSIIKNMENEENFSYICNCNLYIHQVPKSIHEELASCNTVLKCEKCRQVLSLLEVQNLDENIDDYEKDFKELESSL